MKTRRHHNNKGYRQIRRGACANEVKRIARKYGLRYVERLKRRDTGEITMQQTQRQLPPEIQAKIARNAAARERRKTALPSVDNIDPADQRIEIAKTIAGGTVLGSLYTQGFNLANPFAGQAIFIAELRQS